MHNLTIIHDIGNTVAHFDGIPAAALNDEDFLKKLRERIYPEIGFLPPVVRWMSPSKRIVIFERTPTVQTIHYQAASKSALLNGYKAKEHIFHIPLPWMLYVVEIGTDYHPCSIAGFAMGGQLQDTNQRVGLLPMLNFYDSGAVCLPDHPDMIITNIGDSLRLAYTQVWHGGFNHDLFLAFQRARHSRRPLGLFQGLSGRITPLKLFRHWQKKSLEEIASYNDWILPRGFSMHSYASPAIKVRNVYELEKNLLMIEQQKGFLNLRNNLLITLKGALI